MLLPQMFWKCRGDLGDCHNDGCWAGALLAVGRDAAGLPAVDSTAPHKEDLHHKSRDFLKSCQAGQ